MAKKHPEWIPGLAAYMAQIVQASRQFRGNPWVEYDTSRRMQAAAVGNINLAEVDTSLWEIAFANAEPREECRCCSSLDHVSAQCQQEPQDRDKSPPPKRRRRQICDDFNRGDCRWKNCSFVTSAADVREAIPTTNVPKAGDAGRQEARIPTPGPRSGRGADLSEEERARTTHKTLVIHAVVPVTRHRIVAAV